jgi:hypothetical protein
MVELIETAGVYAVVIVALVQAIRARVPSLDGWPVLVVAAVAAIAIVGLFMPTLTSASALEAGRIAVLAWLTAVGGDAWATKIATKGKLTTVIDTDAWREAPTVKDRPTVPPTGAPL